MLYPNQAIPYLTKINHPTFFFLLARGQFPNADFEEIELLNAVFQAHKRLWADSPILEANPLNINPRILGLTKINPYEQLLLLARGRFPNQDLQKIELLTPFF